MAQGKAFTKEQRERIIESLKYYLELGYSRAKACKFIGFDETTLSKWVVNDESLSMKLTSWENAINVRARANIRDNIERGDVNDSKWWSERKEKDEFSTKVEQDINFEPTTIEIKQTDVKKDN